MKFNDRRKTKAETCTNCYKNIDGAKEKITYVNSYYDKSEQNPLCSTCGKGTPKEYITAISTPKKGKVEYDRNWDY